MFCIAGVVGADSQVEGGTALFMLVKKKMHKFR